MNAKLESILVVTGRDGSVIAIVRRDPKVGKQVIMMTADASSEDVAGLITGAADPTPTPAQSSN